MQLSVQGKQIDVGDALRDHIRDRLTRTLDKFFGDAIDVKVTLSRNAHLYRALISANVRRGVHMEAQGEADLPYPAFDMACDHLAKRLRRHKGRLRHHHKEIANRETLSAQQYILSGDLEDLDQDGPDDEAVGQDQPVVVAEMATDILSLTVSEAVMHLDLAGHPALMFRNSAHGGLNMIYRRQDGNIGWVDPRGNRSS
jgi:ribosomal subunit interface protein